MKSFENAKVKSISHVLNHGPEEPPIWDDDTVLIEDN